MGLRLLFGLLFGWFVIVAVRRMRERRVTDDWDAQPRDRADAQTRSRADAQDEIDRAELEAAEKEVKDMDTDAKGRPLDQGIGDDWGPGTPKPPYI